MFPEQTDDLRSGGAPRIDPKFVNNPELSDIQFRVEGRIFYAHKLGKLKFVIFLTNLMISKTAIFNKIIEWFV